MKMGKQDWAIHVAAIKAQRISTIAYARQHDLARSTLYYWQHKLQAASAVHAKAEMRTAPQQPSQFIALRLSEPERVPPAPTHCTLVLGAGVRLEMAALPAPQWLADLSRCAHGAH